MNRFLIVLSTVLLLMSLNIGAQDRGLTLMVKELGTNNRAGRQYLFLIAIDKYQQWMPLKNPVRDARELKEILASRYYIDETIELYDEAATKANIIKTFTGLQKKLQVNDSLLVYYAGHGHLDKNTNSGFWIPVNAGTDGFEQANWLPNTQIRGLISNIQAIHLLVVSDSCFSGDLLNSSRGLQEEINIDYFKRAYGRISRQILTSGASETVPDESEFARMLKMALKKNNQPYFDPLMLFNEIRLGVRGTMPMFGNLKDTGHQEGASFLLFLKEEKPQDVVKKEEPKKEEPKAVVKIEEPKKEEPKAVVKAEKTSALAVPTGWSVIFADEFDKPALDKRWRWVREQKSDWSLKTKPGFLSILGGKGDLWTTRNDNSNILLAEAPASDFAIETRVDIDASENYHIGGPLIYLDDDNYVRISVTYTDGRHVEIVNEVKGVFAFQKMPYPKNPAYLRLVKYGDMFSGYVSADGREYTFIASVKNNLTGKLKAGLVSNNSDAKTRVHAFFDFVRVLKVPPEAGFFADEFDQPALNKRWGWVREDARYWSLKDKPGSLTLTAVNGDLWERQNNSRNLLLTEAPAGDFILETRLDFSPVENLQQAGLIVYRDDDNFVRLSMIFADERKIEVIHELNGVPSYKNVRFSPSSVRLRLVKNGGTYSGFYSEDGVSYKLVAEVTADLGPKLRIGLMAHNKEATRNPAAFEYFRVSPAAAAVGRRFTDDFNGDKLDASWSWVREHSSYWSLKEKQGFLTIKTEEGDMRGGGRNSRNILLTATDLTDYQLDVKLEFNPTSLWQRSGLIVYLNDDNYLHLIYVYDNAQKVEIGVESNGGFTNRAVEFQSPVVYLRLIKNGENFSGWASKDGNTYVSIGEYKINFMERPRVGLLAINGGESRAHNIPAHFEYFRVSPASAGVTQGFTDDFNGDKLGASWSWVREKPSGWSLVKKPGTLAVDVERGDLTKNDNRNMLLTDTGMEDYAIETRITFSAPPSENYQQAGLAVYVDDDNYLKFMYQASDGQTLATLSNETNGAYTPSNKASFSASVVHLRLVKKGDRYYASVSADGRDFRLVSERTVVFGKKPRVGLIAYGWEASSTITAFFDYFKVTVQ